MVALIQSRNLKLRYKQLLKPVNSKKVDFLFAGLNLSTNVPE